MQLDVLLEQRVELLGRVQEVRQGLVPQTLGDQFIADQQMPPHQGDVAIKANARVLGAAVREIGLPALRRSGAGGSGLLAVCGLVALVPGILGWASWPAERWRC